MRRSDTNTTAQPRAEEDAPKTNVVELSGSEYGYLLPEKVQGGWTTFEFANTGREPHEFALAKLGAGKTIDDVRRYLSDPASQQQPPPAWVQIRSGIPTLDAGEEAALTQRLEPGRYVLLCFLDAPDGKSHIEHGMLRTFDVEGDAGAAAPEADATLVLGGRLAAPQTSAGEQTFELRNDGDGPGSVFLTAFEPGKTEKDLAHWEENGLRGPAPATFLGGAIDVPPKLVRLLHRQPRGRTRVHALRRRARAPEDLHAAVRQVPSTRRPPPDGGFASSPLGGPSGWQADRHERRARHPAARCREALRPDHRGERP